MKLGYRDFQQEIVKEPRISGVAPCARDEWIWQVLCNVCIKSCGLVIQLAVLGLFEGVPDKFDGYVKFPTCAFI